MANQTRPAKAGVQKPSKLGAEKLTPDEQRRRFIESARGAGASEDEAEFDKALGAITEVRDETLKRRLVIDSRLLSALWARWSSGYFDKWARYRLFSKYSPTRESEIRRYTPRAGA